MSLGTLGTLGTLPRARHGLAPLKRSPSTSHRRDGFLPPGSTLVRRLQSR